MRKMNSSSATNACRVEDSEQMKKRHARRDYRKMILRKTVVICLLLPIALYFQGHLHGVESDWNKGDGGMAWRTDTFTCPGATGTCIKFIVKDRGWTWQSEQLFKVPSCTTGIANATGTDDYLLVKLAGCSEPDALVRIYWEDFESHANDVKVD